MAASVKAKAKRGLQDFKAGVSPTKRSAMKSGDLTKKQFVRQSVKAGVKERMAARGKSLDKEELNRKTGRRVRAMRKVGVGPF